MNNFTNPLANVKVASPCPANWNEMYGNERKRYCGECKLNVYNLSEMTQSEAENFVIKAEGRVCVKFYRRADGTVLTKDCPVGLARLKQKVSRMATAFASICAGILGGIFAFTQFQPNSQIQDGKLINTDAVETINPLNEVESIEPPTTLGDFDKAKVFSESPEQKVNRFGAASVGMLLMEPRETKKKEVKSKKHLRRKL